MVKHAVEKLRTNPGSLYSFSLIFIAATLSLVASLVLSVEAFRLAQNPDVVLSCDVNAFISCGTVARHSSAALLGFPNSFIGMMAEPVFIALAIFVLAGVRFPRWIMRGAQVGADLALIFAGWMFYTSYFVIGALCPWCLVVSFSTVVLWFALTRFNIIHRNLFLAGRAEDWLRSVVKKDYDRLAMWATMVLMVVAIIFKYGQGLF